MALAKLTLIGLNAYTDGHIWDLFRLPEGIDREVAKNEIMMQCGEFQLLYPDANFMRDSIGHFSRKWFHNFEKWFKAEQFDYNPLFNMDVENTISENINRNENNISNSKTVSSSNTAASTNSNANGSITEKVAAYNTDDFANAKITISDDTSNTSGNTSNDSNVNTDLNGTNNEAVTTTRTEKRAGNQGVTMSQDMLKSEYEVRKWNIYQHIADVFASEYCLSVYE